MRITLVVVIAVMLAALPLQVSLLVNEARVTGITCCCASADTDAAMATSCCHESPDDIPEDGHCTCVNELCGCAPIVTWYVLTSEATYTKATAPSPDFPGMVNDDAPKRTHHDIFHPPRHYGCPVGRQWNVS